MLFLRRLLLMVIVLTVPAASVWCFSWLTQYMLHATSRVADPTILLYMSYGEFALFTFGALVEARSRWSPPSHYQ